MFVFGTYIHPEAMAIMASWLLELFLDSAWVVAVYTLLYFGTMVLA